MALFGTNDLPSIITDIKNLGRSTYISRLVFVFKYFTMKKVHVASELACDVSLSSSREAHKYNHQLIAIGSSFTLLWCMALLRHGI